jgi:hypothetical protein
MRNYMLTTSRQRKFQYHVVIGIGQEWPPKEVNLLQMTLAGKITDKPQGIVRRSARRQVFLARQDILPFCIKPDGEARDELRRGN